MFEINEKTLITKGLPLSPKFLLDHTTTGAFHYLMGRWTPTYTSLIRPGQSTLPSWDIARNLQIGSNLFLEKLLGEFGGDFILSSALGSKKHQLSGNSFDIQINGFQNNMFNVAKDIQKIAKRAKDLQLVFGDVSYMRINFDKNSLLKSPLSTDLPDIQSIDTITGDIKNGIEALRGFI